MQNARLDESQVAIKTVRKNTKKSQALRWYDFNGRKQRGTKEPLDEDERVEWRAGLKPNNQNTKNIASVPSLHGK